MPRRPRSRPQLVALEPRDCPAVTLVSEGGPGDGPAMANGASTTMAVSANGKRIAYQTTGTNLVASSLDTNGVLDVFVFDRGTGLNTIASHIGMFAITGNDESKSATISADGSTVVFTTVATNFAASDANGLRDVFAYRNASGGAMMAGGAGVAFAEPVKIEADSIKPAPPPPRTKPVAQTFEGPRSRIETASPTPALFAGPERKNDGDGWDWLRPFEPIAV